MVYMGSKARLAKELVPIIQSYIDSTNPNLYIEPFVGGANIIDKIKCKRKIGCDINPYLIALLQNAELIQTLPDTISLEEYKAVKQSYDNQDHKYEDWYIGAIGFIATYRGKFFGGKLPDEYNEKGKIRNFFAEHKNNLLKQAPQLKNIEFYTKDYRSIEPQELYHAVIYCDIPYQDTTDYKTQFNHKEFWAWAEEMSKDNIVLVSEKQAPEGWEPIWSKQIRHDMDYHKEEKSLVTEKLFIYKNS